MLASNGIIFLDLHLLRHVALVLVGSVEMTGSSTGYQTNFLACRFCHCQSPLNLLAAGADVRKHRIDTFLVDNAHTFGAEAKLYPAVLTLNPELVGV